MLTDRWSALTSCYRCCVVERAWSFCIKCNRHWSLLQSSLEFLSRILSTWLLLFLLLSSNQDKSTKSQVRIVDLCARSCKSARGVPRMWWKNEEIAFHYRVAGVKLRRTTEKRRSQGVAGRRLPGSKVARERRMRVIEDPIFRSVGGLKSWYMVRANERDNIDILSGRGSPLSPAVARFPPKSCVRLRSYVF